MNLFKKIRQTFCIHDWKPITILDIDIYNEYNIRYAKCYSVCSKCGKTDDVDYMLSADYQDRWKNI